MEVQKARKFICKVTVLPLLRERRKKNMPRFLLALSLLGITVSLTCAQEAGSGGSSSNVTQLHIAYIVSFGGEYDSSGSLVAVEMARERINQHPGGLLEGYELVIETPQRDGTGDSQCDRTRSLETFFNQLTTGEDKIAVVGCGCSVATEPVAEISHFWNITHMAYSSATATLSDRSRFPNFWRTYPSEADLTPAVLALIRQYNWTQIKIITEDESLFTVGTDALRRELSARNVTVVDEGLTLFRSDVNVGAAERLFAPEVRVYLLNMYSVHARRIMCAATREMRQAEEEDFDPRFHHASYVWLTLGWYREGWWTAEVVNDTLTPNCSSEDLAAFISRTVGIQQFPTADNDTTETDVQLTAEEFTEEYNSRLVGTGLQFESTGYHGYDAIWSLAFAIQNASARLPEGTSLDNFNYKETGAVISELIQQELNYTFTGVSGEVSFDAVGTREGIDPRILKYELLSSSEAARATVAIVDMEAVLAAAAAGQLSNTSFIYLGESNDSTVWPDGVPSDGIAVIELTTILQPLFIVYSILASLGIVFAIVCLMFNIIFRKRKIVRLISPNLNYVIIIGAILLYASVYLFVFPSSDFLTYTLFCHFRAWLQALGYFLCFGIIVAKMWRVYYIFRHPSVMKKNRAPQDWHLFVGVLIMCLVAVVILAFAAGFDDYKATEVLDKERPATRTEDFVRIEYHTLVCEGNRSIFWIIVFYGYIVITMLTAVFLAFRTRKVKIKALNDAKNISVIIYITLFILSVMVVGAALLGNYINADAGVFGGGLLIFTTVVLGLVFIPKMVILYRDPQGENIFERTGSINRPGTLNGTVNDEDRARIAELDRHCKQLSTRLSKYETVEPFRSSISKMRAYSQNSILSVPASPMRSLTTTITAVTTHTLPPLNTGRAHSDRSSNTSGDNVEVSQRSPPVDVEKGISRIEAVNETSAL